MNTNTMRLQDRLTQLKALLGSLYAPEAQQELDACQTCCNQLLLDGTALTTSNTSADDKRQIIANMHVAVKRMQEALDAISTATADTYRKQVGPDKETFEMLSSQLQQRQNPAAYRSFEAFHQAQQLLDQLSGLNASLLDTSSMIEQADRPASAPTTGPAPQFDRDPAPSSLSP
jgi:hypothetical protein